MNALQQFLQSASNEAAGAVSAPVDMIAWALRKAGVPVPQNALMSSDWMKMNGLMADVPQTGASLAGQTFGLLSPVAAAAKAPQIARGLLAAGDNLAAPAAQGMKAGQRGGVPLASDEAARLQRMQEMGLERGWYRGGPEIKDGKRSGPWYTRDADEARGYMPAKSGEVREYAIPSGQYLNAERGYNSQLAHDVAKVLDDPYYGKAGAGLAKELRSFEKGEGITGGQLWQALEARFGNDGAAEVIGKLGHFKGAKGMTRADEAYVFKAAPVRDAQRAKFDPSSVGKDDIYGRITLPELAAVAGTSLLGAHWLRKQDQGRP